MSKLRKITLNNKEIGVYELTVNGLTDGDENTPFYERLEGLDKDTDNPVHTLPEDSAEIATTDFVIKLGDKYYLIPNDDNVTEFNQAVFAAMTHEENNQDFARIRRTYRKRQLEAQAVHIVVPSAAEAPVDGIKQLNLHAPYHTGGFVAAPALAGGMTLTNWSAGTWASNLISTSAFLNGLLIVPAIAAIGAGAMNFALNCAVHMVENNGKLPKGDALKKISDDSWKKSVQMGLGFAAIGVIEHFLMDSLKSAWGGVATLGGGVTVLPALMLSTSLAIGFGMAIGSLLMQAVQKEKNQPINWSEVGLAFVSGMLAGAAASINYGTGLQATSFSFLSIWAALSVVPAAKVAVSAATDQNECVLLSNSWNNMQDTAKTMFFSRRPVLNSQDDDLDVVGAKSDVVRIGNHETTEERLNRDTPALVKPPVTAQRRPSIDI
jgi:hypothetical protein